MGELEPPQLKKFWFNVQCDYTTFGWSVKK